MDVPHPFPFRARKLSRSKSETAYGAARGSRLLPGKRLAALFNFPNVQRVCAVVDGGEAELVFGFLQSHAEG